MNDTNSRTSCEFRLQCPLVLLKLISVQAFQDDHNDNFLTEARPRLQPNYITISQAR